ncbi:hypothetical protein DYB34_014151, partial [Aphanomyces astaci]
KWALNKEYIGDLPAFNCAEDGNDSGCLTSPAAYYSNVRFPAIRPPEDGTKKTDMQQLEQASAYDSPSIDPCWLAMGQSVTAGYITLTCSGFGFCPSGPNATCVCNNHATSFDCSGGDDTVGAWSQTGAWSWWDAVIFAACGGFGLMVMGLAAWRRYHRSRQEDPLLRTTVPNYGASKCE